MRVGVIGVGIIGASVGWHLAKRGVEVVLIDAVQPGEGVTNWTSLGSTPLTSLRPKSISISTWPVWPLTMISRQRSIQEIGGTPVGTCGGSRMPMEGTDCTVK
jgi:glycine/D-amino acid oxidase-like deaminating enzyme